MEFLNSSMEADLIELTKMQESLRVTGVSMGMDSFDRRMQEFLKKVKTFVEKYKPESYSVTVGFPLGASVTFTWES